MPAHEIRTTTEFAEDVRAGLDRNGQKELPSKYLYDELGSALFEAITVLPEYGLTRAEHRILRQHADAITARVSSPALVAELGSGSGKKTRWILEALARRQPTTYHPIEISRSALVSCERQLDHLVGVSIVGLEKEYLEGLVDVASRRQPGQHVLVLFLGSSIGNFDRGPAERFLEHIRRTLIQGDGLLLGTDLVKSIPLMIQAYDDPTGVTAAFNLNLLARINRELDGDFNLSQFQHLALYNPGGRRIEMHLRSTATQTVTIPGADLVVTLVQDETIWTENCHKYSLEEPVHIAERTGFRCEGQWNDDQWRFAESLFIAI
jgi:dimethylhistidine N-methyltransferase